MAHSSWFLGPGSVGLVREETLVALVLCCQPKELSQMLHKAGWVGSQEAQAPQVTLLGRDLREKLGWETPMGWVQREFASY